MRALFVLVPLLLAAGAAPAPDLPVTSYAGAPDGVASALNGNWAFFRPGGEDNTLGTCAAPATLSDLGNGVVRHQLPGREPLDYAFSIENGLSVLAAEGEPSFTVVWIAGDEFALYPAAENGAIDQAEAAIFHRCPDWPRASYTGARDGWSDPFAGNWSLETPSPTANHPNTVLVACTDPARIRTDGIARLGYQMPGEELRAIILGTSEGRTRWIWPAFSDTWEIVWIDENTFTANLQGMFGTTEWSNPYIYRRCEKGN